MNCRFVFLSLIASVACTAAQAQTSGMISSADVRRAGLEQRWSAHLAVDGTRSVLKQIGMHVSSTTTNRFYEVSYEANSFDFRPDSADDMGNPLGPNGAETAAEQKLRQLVALEVPATISSKTEGDVTTHTVACAVGKFRFRPSDRDTFGKSLGEEGIEAAGERRVELLTAASITATSARVDVPRVRLFATATNAVVHAVDGESGRTMWKRRVGDARYPSFRAAMNEKEMAIVNGSTLYLVDQATGRALWQRSINGTPGASPALSTFYAFVPTVRGRLEVYLIERGNAPPATIYQASGRALVTPTVTPRSVIWPTDLGHMYLAEADEPRLRFRLEANSDIVAAAAYLPPNLIYVASVDGYVYCIDDVKQNIRWQVSLGTPMSLSPVAVGEQLFIATDEHQLICLSAKTGKQIWGPTTNIGRVIAVSEKRVYALDRRGDLTILQRDTGGRTSTIRLNGSAIPFVNTQTDRLFLTNRAGLVVCLHEVENEFPLLHLDTLEPQADGEADMEKETDGGMSTEELDPFGERIP
jgi:hypothetical protein